MFKNRYAAPCGTQYDGCGEFNTLRQALAAADSAITMALPGTRWLGARPWGLELRHAA